MEFSQLYAPATLPQEKEPLISIEYEAGWDPELVWMHCKREKSCALAITVTIQRQL